MYTQLRKKSENAVENFDPRNRPLDTPVAVAAY